MAHDREVAGIRCTRVLECLSDYVDGEVGADLAATIEAHLRGCDWCDRFGRDFSGVVKALRSELTKDEFDTAVARRVMARIRPEVAGHRNGNDA